MIEALNLTKRYGSVVSVDDLTFTVRPGRVTGFLGPNGAGKSTTMRLIVGLDRPTGGQTLVGGERYADLRAPLRTVGALLDARWVHPRRSGRDHLRWLARSNDIAAARVDEVLGLTGLTAVAGRRAGQYSLGMSQRLGIAAALLGDPQILLFDEPVNGLDPEGIQWIRGLMKGLAAEGRTVLVSSHLLSEMAVTADHLIVIGRGRLIRECSVAELVGEAAVTEVRVRTPEPERLTALLTDAGFEVAPADTRLRVTGATSEEIGRLAASAGVVLFELTPEVASLETAYLALTSNAVDYRAAPAASLA